MTTKLHDKDAVLDYRFNFGVGDNGEPPWLADGEAITSHTSTVTGATKQSSNHTGGTAVTVWVTGGTVGTPATILVHIVTNQGRADDRTMFLRVVER